MENSSNVTVVDRLIMRLASQDAPSLCLLIEQLPLIFRVVAIVTQKTATGKCAYIAEVFNERASLRVKWLADSFDARLKLGSLASIRWKGQTICEQGAIIISRLVLVNEPPKQFNIFETVPVSWVKNRSLIERAIAIQALLPTRYQKLINGILWDQKRFWQFLNFPSSMQHHHAIPHGNLIHTLEVCELAQKVTLNEKVNMPLLTLICFLHDIGKAAEYWYEPNKQRFYLSKRGKLLGHKLTALEWLIEAKNNFNLDISEPEWLEILHGVTATQGIADWTGFRHPVTLESTLVSSIDNISGKQGI